MRGTFSRERRVRRAWAALGRDATARRLVQMAAACGMTVFAATDAGEGMAAMSWLLDACMGVERGRVPRLEAASEISTKQYAEGGTE